MDKTKEKNREKIKTVELNLSYGNNRALKNINLGIKSQQITALIGPSGCGKSSFLRCLNRMNDEIAAAAVTGQVLLDERDIYAPKTDVVELRKKVGMVFQQPNPFPMSIYDNVAFGPRIHGRQKKALLEDTVEKALRLASLWDEVKHRLKYNALSLSGGQQQRLVIARVLAVEPEVILMDEPASALDPISTAKLEELIQNLKQKYTIVIVTHNMQQAARISDWTGFFYEGNLEEYGSTRQIFTKPQEKRTEDYITGRFG